jgi:hypothetical protein
MTWLLADDFVVFARAEANDVCKKGDERRANNWKLQ